MSKNRDWGKLGSRGKVKVKGKGRVSKLPVNYFHSDKASFLCPSNFMDIIRL